MIIILEYQEQVPSNCMRRQQRKMTRFAVERAYRSQWAASCILYRTELGKAGAGFL